MWNVSGILCFLFFLQLSIVIDFKYLSRAVYMGIDFYALPIFHNLMLLKFCATLEIF